MKWADRISEENNNIQRSEDNDGRMAVRMVQWYSNKSLVQSK